MRIVTWNCNGALRKKFSSLIEVDADLSIVQECENPVETTDQEYKDWASNHLWIGANKNKGVGIFASDKIHLEKLPWGDKFNGLEVRYFLPCIVNHQFQLLGIWAHSNRSPTFGYIGQFWKYLQLNESKFDNAILAGDLNSNKQWDKWDRWWNHTDVVNSLKQKGIDSIYHEFFQENQGEESQPTFFLQKNETKPYHIDYIFTSKSLRKHINHFEVGEASAWLKLSDHFSLIMDIQFND